MSNNHGSVSRKAIEKLAAHALAVAYSDSHVELDAKKVCEAIEGDMAMNGFVITKEQIDVLIMGEDGEVPRDLKLAFSGLNFIIAKEYGE